MNPGALNVLALCMTAGAAGLMAACSGGDSGPPEVSFLHYVETVTGQMDGEPLDSREEGWYRAPDSARIVTNVTYTALGLENIVIGPQVWERRESGWRASTTNVDCYNAMSKINSLLRYGGLDDAKESRDGPTVSGESTLVYRWEYEDAGRLLISASDRSLGESPEAREVQARTEEIFSDLTGTTELVIGKETGRIYSLIDTREGPKLSDRREVVIDQYDEPVVIEPPPNVPAPTQDTVRSECPAPPGDMPWIPAAIAALLIPVVFLVGSAFLWPRRI